MDGAVIKIQKSVRVLTGALVSVGELTPTAALQVVGPGYVQFYTNLALKKQNF
jgi:hypothetical protein